jgi:hypothetical protein
MACDCSIVHWHDNEQGEALNIGRKTRSIPPAIRRALKRRDGGCRFPGCSCTRFVDAHHIQHWADGGETKMDNLILLCRRHHRLLHEEGFRLHRAMDGGIDFTLPDGEIIPANEELGLNITSNTSVPEWYGEKMDHSLAVLGLIQNE